MSVKRKLLAEEEQAYELRRVGSSLVASAFLALLLLVMALASMCG